MAWWRRRRWWDVRILFRWWWRRYRFFFLFFVVVIMALMNRRGFRCGRFARLNNLKGIDFSQISCTAFAPIHFYIQVLQALFQWNMDVSLHWCNWSGGFCDHRSGFDIDRWLWFTAYFLIEFNTLLKFHQFYILDVDHYLNETTLW